MNLKRVVKIMFIEYFTLHLILLKESVSLAADEISHGIAWNHYVEKFNKTNLNNRDFDNFGHTLRYISEFKIRKSKCDFKFDVGLNHFSHWSPEDRFKLAHQVPNLTWLSELLVDAEQYEVNWTRSRLVEKFLDYRKSGVVSSLVRYQGICNSCWAASAVEAMQSQIYFNHGKMYNLSIQNGVDCSTPFGTLGCEGGFPTAIYKCCGRQSGYNLESCYPYKYKDNPKCLFKKSCNVPFICAKYTQLPQFNVAGVMEGLSFVGPVTCLINSHPQSFINYRSGVYNDPECYNDTLTHVVLLCGFGTANGSDYWLIKNSWGTTWGEKGYMRLSRSNNLCNILRQCTYPNMLPLEISTT